MVPHSCENKAISAPSWAWAWAWAELGKNITVSVNILCNMEMERGGVEMSSLDDHDFARGL